MSDKRILIFGETGYIGSQVKNYLSQKKDFEIIKLPKRVDICHRDAVEDTIRDHAPNYVINCAGITGDKNIDDCKEKADLCDQVNSLGVAYLLSSCIRNHCCLVHISSGCIYDGPNFNSGDLSWSEMNAPNFMKNPYTVSKGIADQLLVNIYRSWTYRAIINLRIRMPFGNFHHPKNLITKLSAYQQVIDHENSITYVPTLVRAIGHLITHGYRGTYNVVNKGVISPYRIACEIRSRLGHEEPIEKISEYHLWKQGKTFYRRSNCRLSCKKIESSIGLLPTAESCMQQALDSIYPGVA